MGSNRKTNGFRKFLNNVSENPLFVALGAGLYPLVFYYSRNFGLINSWEQFGYFVMLFLLFPLLFFSVLKWISKRSFALKWGKYLLPFFSVFLFLFFLKIILYVPVERKIIVVIIIISFVAAYFLNKQFKKWIVLQLILAVIGIIGLVPLLLNFLNYSSAWTRQPDDIEKVVFQKKPNIYYIQPDGYVNFSELEKGFYQVNNSGFKSFLAENKFKDYPHFRSNYLSTLTSNSATFMMKHHYYNNAGDFSEMLYARKNIISQNTVLTIFKNNGYQTHLIVEHPYLMVNRPKMGYTTTNFKYEHIPYRTTGFEVGRNVYVDLETAIASEKNTVNFFFIEFFQPGHIASVKSASRGSAMEREKWLEKREIANGKIKKLVNLIVEKDPGALIMIMADHGGFVGLDYTLQIYNKTSDPDIIYSAFGSMLAIRWPQSEVPAIDSHLKSSVNVFRILFSYLSNDKKYLEHLQPDKSYVILKERVPNGVYEYLDENGEVTCKKI